MEIFLGSNLRLLRKRKNLTQEDIAKVAKLKRATYCGIELGNSFPGIESLVALSDYFGVAIDTLVKIDLQKLSGFQLSELEKGNDVFIKGSTLRIISSTVNPKGIDNIELVPVKAKAGYTTGFADPEYINELPRFQLPFLSNNRKYRTFQISGDSMLPIPENSWITAEYVQDWYSIQSGKPYIILTLNDGIVFKIADNLIQDEGKLRLYSLNTAYEPYDVAVTEIKEVWRFIHFISSEIPEPEDANEVMTRRLHQHSKEIQMIKQYLKEKKTMM